MPGAPKITLEQAAMAVEAVEGLGYSQDKAGELAGISGPSVCEILHGKYRWGEYLDGPVFKELRARQKQAFQVATFELARQSLIQAEKSLPKASFLQAVTGYGILRDKERLDAGEPTEIVGHIHKHDLSGLDELAKALGQALTTGEITATK